MALIINTNITAMNAQRNLAVVTDGLTKTFQRLSSGMRINTAMDDAAGLAISTRMTSQIKGLSMAIRNANDGISMVQVTEGAMEETISALQRIRELAVQSANGTLTDNDRTDLQLEVDQLLAEIQRIANDTQFNGFTLMTGKFLSTASTRRMVIQVGAREGQAISFSIGDMRLSGLGLGMTSLWSYNASTEESAQKLSSDGSTGKLGYLPMIATRLAAESAIKTLDSVLDRVVRQRSNLGAVQTRFTSVIANLSNVVENMSAARSRILDADVAAETASLTQKAILQQAGTAVLAQANQQPKLALQLLS
ncbi:MAG: flagellin FliC [Magnetococcales bacterium]|nr:flagellin FliC [Magnetococcales bacterium]